VTVTVLLTWASPTNHGSMTALVLAPGLINGVSQTPRRAYSRATAERWLNLQIKHGRTWQPCPKRSPVAPPSVEL